MKYLSVLLVFCGQLWGVDLLEVDIRQAQLTFGTPVSRLVSVGGEEINPPAQVFMPLQAQREEIRWFVGERQIGYLCWGNGNPADRFWLDDAIRQNLWSGGCIRRPAGSNLERLLLRSDCRGLTQKNAACYYWANIELSSPSRQALPEILNRQLLSEYNLSGKILEIRAADGTLLSTQDVTRLKRGLFFLRLHNGATVPFWSQP